MIGTYKEFYESIGVEIHKSREVDEIHKSEI